MMRERRISTILLIFILFLGYMSKAQTRKELIAFGDNAFHSKHYASAAYYYLQVLDPSVKKEVVLTYPYEVNTFQRTKAKKDSSKKGNEENSQTQYVVHQLAASYRLNADYENAEKWYATAIKSKDTAYPKDLLYYAEVLMNNRKYNEAKTICDSILKKDTLIHDQDILELAKNATLGCFYAQDPSSQNKDIAVYLMDSAFNAGTSSYGLRFYGNEKHVSFTSGRSSNVVANPKKQDPKYRSDIYVADRNGKKFSNFHSIGSPVNTENNEGSGYLSIDKTTFYFTRRDAVTGQTAIYVSKYFNGKWLTPLKIDNKVNVAGYDSKDPCLSLDGSSLFYSSDRPHGKGGYDIWMCHIDDFGNLSAPKNLSNINTPGDEVAPFYHYNTKTLFFSSNGLVGLGGLDVYKASYNNVDSSFGTPKNLGGPINSSKDDAYYTLTKNQTIGYVSSDRSPCKDCGKDYSGSHYCYKIYKFSKPENHYKIKGIVYDANTNEPIANALVTFKDVTYTVDPFFVITNAKGEYEKDLQPGLLLFLKAQKVNYFADAASISTKGLTSSKTFIHDFYLNPIPKKDIDLPGIYYDFDKATLRPSSKKVLDKLVKFLNVNDNIVIQINSYTDQQGSDTYNQRLSQARAKSVVDYLIANGIKKDRLKAKGYGEQDPIVSQADIDKMPTKKEKDAGYQKNRRTTFKVLSQNYKDITK